MTLESSGVSLTILQKINCWRDEKSKRVWSEYSIAEVENISRTDSIIIAGPWLFWQHWIRFVHYIKAEIDRKKMFIKIRARSSWNCMEIETAFKISWWLCSGLKYHVDLSMNRCELNFTTHATLFHWALFHHHRRLFTLFDFQFMHQK